MNNSTPTIRTRTLAGDPAVLPAAPLMGPLVLFSAAAHFFALTLLVAWPALFAAKAGPPVVMRVHTISLPRRGGEINPGGAPSATPATPAAAEPATVASAAPAPPKDDLALIRLAGATPPAPIVKSAPSAPAPVAASAASSHVKPAGAPGSEGHAGSSPGPGGFGGGTGLASGGGAGVAFDEDFSQTWYQAALERRIKAVWNKPSVTGGKKIVQIHFVIVGDKATELQILRPSGDYAFDQSALRAVESAQPLPPLPAAGGKDKLGATFEFHSQE